MYRTSRLDAESETCDGFILLPTNSCGRVESPRLSIEPAVPQQTSDIPLAIHAPASSSVFICLSVIHPRTHAFARYLATSRSASGPRPSHPRRPSDQRQPRRLAPHIPPPDRPNSRPAFHGGLDSARGPHGTGPRWLAPAGTGERVAAQDPERAKTRRTRT